MNPRFQRAFEKLEQQRQHVAELVKNLPENIYTTAPTGKWSIAQIMAHLLTSETLTVGYMRKKSLGIEKLKNSGLRHVLTLELLKVSQRGPFRFTAPKVVVDHTPQPLPPQEAIACWDKSRNELKQFLDTISDKHARRLIYKHPIAGMLDGEQALKFMYEHVNHHLPQIKCLLKP